MAAPFVLGTSRAVALLETMGAETSLAMVQPRTSKHSLERKVYFWYIFFTRLLSSFCPVCIFSNVPVCFKTKTEQRNKQKTKVFLKENAVKGLRRKTYDYLKYTPMVDTIGYTT